MFYPDLLVCLRFFSRIPFPMTHAEAERATRPFANAAAMVPVAGAIVGLVPAAALLVAIVLGVPAALAAPLALAALVAATGALHEDGLADCADGFGGGRTGEQKLAIMRDSRIGTFGACAITLSLYVRATSLGILAAHGAWAAAADVVFAGGLSRTACLLPLILLPPARAEGLGATAGRPSLGRLAIAMTLATTLGLLVIPFGAIPVAVFGAVALATAGTVGVCAVARRQIGGQTGDVVGASQQVAEIITLLVLATAASR